MGCSSLLLPAVRIKFCYSSSPSASLKQHGLFFSVGNTFKKKTLPLKPTLRVNEPGHGSWASACGLVKHF